MKYLSSLVASCVLFILFTGCGTNKRELFNGKDLTGWDTFIGPRYDTARKKFDSIKGPGLNNDIDHVFTVVQMEGEGAIRVSGEFFGGISTTEEFSNYHLTVQFKWGQAKYAPKLDEVRDSGMLYHAVGPHGADSGFWMRSQEFQVEEGNCGDYWGCAGALFDVPATQKGENVYVYDPKGPMTTFAEGSEAGRNCIKNPDGEKPSGEWNTLDLFVYGDTAVHVVNGVTNMVLYHSRQSDSGTETPLKRGKIQFQSEGAELFYRRIQVESIASIPGRLLGK